MNGPTIPDEVMRRTHYAQCNRIAAEEFHRALLGFTRLDPVQFRPHIDKITASLLDEHVRRRKESLPSDENFLRDLAYQEARKTRQGLEDSLLPPSSAPQRGLQGGPPFAMEALGAMALASDRRSAIGTEADRASLADRVRRIEEGRTEELALLACSVEVDVAWWLTKRPP